MGVGADVFAADGLVDQLHDSGHVGLNGAEGGDQRAAYADAEQWLERAGIIVNKNGIPNDPRPPMVTSGLRLGTPALTTRGMKEAEMREVAQLLDRVMDAKGNASTCADVRENVRELCARFPLFHP